MRRSVLQLAATVSSFMALGWPLVPKGRSGVWRYKESRRFAYDTSACNESRSDAEDGVSLLPRYKHCQHVTAAQHIETYHHVILPRSKRRSVPQIFTAQPAVTDRGVPTPDSMSATRVPPRRQVTVSA
ncbi:hypothetical protein BDZ89DRAFT_1250417, partial [Hymenopellis radicata]